jgi:hypothetical protein
MSVHKTLSMRFFASFGGCFCQLSFAKPRAGELACFSGFWMVYFVFFDWFR